MGKPPIDGVLLVDKPSGPTSHDVVSVVRRSLGIRRVGHAGTLDPFATGLLVVLVGRATRLLPYIDAEPKEYEATVRFGVATDTDDVTGSAIAEAALPSRAAVDAAIEELTGGIVQQPPAFSAKQVGGRRSYAAARRGELLELQPVKVRVHGWSVRAWRDDEMDATVVCSGGTYVRALARDLGKLSGSAAHLGALRRVRSGPFTVTAASTLDEVAAGGATLLPPIEAVRSMPAEQLEEGALARVVNGRPVEATVAGERAALVDSAGALVAVAARASGNGGTDLWQPRLVLRDAS
ncbi:MAG TPA: tRNA pseudouridine(55) synthase TruB [Gemmatimonadaceae bacterium]|nr:tRNA pseudouridine(55) synthase TruB [Gemmatimonadaceae bacterium]